MHTSSSGSGSSIGIGSIDAQQAQFQSASEDSSMEELKPQLTSDPTFQFPYVASALSTQLQEQPDSGTGGTKRSRTEAFGNETENPTDGVTEPPIAKRFQRQPQLDR